MKTIDVLIVNNQPCARNALKALLRFSPIISMIWEASNGEAAMKTICEMRPEVVIMDADMPIMGGIEATNRIKQIWPEIKIIILTTYPIQEEEALAAGADIILAKNDQSYKLPEVIRQLVLEKTDTQTIGPP